MGIGKTLAAAAALALAGSAALAQSPREDAGLGRLVERLGDGEEPTGAGVVVAQVEVAAPQGYAASASHPQLFDQRFELASGPGGASAHATWVGLFLYGRETGMAPGVSDVRSFEVLDWLGEGFLNGSGALPPDALGVAIANNSWVGDAGAESNALVRKLDYAIEQQGLTILGGTANGRGALTYPLLTHSYNGICVGRADGRHGAGETSARLDGPGRMKPELVGPAPASSFATPLVAGAAALLVQTAREHPALAGDADALRPELLKAVLMAGARHRSGWSNGAPSAGPGRGATDRPLDPLFGADVVDVDRSHWILTAGRADSASAPAQAPLARPAGWSVLELERGASAWLRFEVEREKPYVSVLAAWNRRVHAGFDGYDLPDLDLELFERGPQGEPRPLIGAAGLARFVAGNVASESRVDNVEHLYVEGLQPGSYLLRLRRAEDELPPWRVALAWELACAPPLAIGRGKPGSNGQRPRLVSRGAPARFADALELRLEGGPPNGVALVVSSATREDRAFAGGTLHLAPPLVPVARLELDLHGAASLPLPVEEALVGEERLYQVLLVDPEHPDGTGAALSNALRVGFCR